MRKVKLRKIGLCVITGCSIKPFKMIVNHFFYIYFSSTFAAQLWFFNIGISKGEIGNGK